MRGLLHSYLLSLTTTYGAPCRLRSYDPLINSQMLYRAELKGHIKLRWKASKKPVCLPPPSFGIYHTLFQLRVKIIKMTMQSLVVSGYITQCILLRLRSANSPPSGASFDNFNFFNFQGNYCLSQLFLLSLLIVRYSIST